MGFVTDKYKHTEVGIIPEDWEVYILGNLLNGTADVDHFMPKTEKYGVPYVMTGDLKDFVGDIDFDNCKKISISDYEQLSKKVKNIKGDIILARYATIGTVSFVNVDFDFVVSYSCVTVKPDTSKLIDLFLYYYFKSSIFKLEVKNKVNANIQDNVGIGDLLKMKIPLPPTKVEQTAIATALSDADALISSLEKLIAKKRNIKQGAMQQLLIPKNSWQEKRLEETVLLIRSGGTPNSSIKEYYNGSIPFLSIGDMTEQGKYLTHTSNSISQEGIENSASWLVESGSIIYSMYASVGFVSITQIPLSISQAVLCLKFKREYSNEFMYYMLSNMQQSVMKYVGEGTQKNLNAQTVKNFIIKVPSLMEQENIADVLKSMDEELEKLKLKLRKLNEIKQGMMQELLTGKTRLI